MNRRQVVLMAALATLLMLMPSAGADEQFEFEPMVYDIAATPSGSILVGESAGAILGADPGDMAVKEIHRGEVGVLTELDLPTVVNGLDAIGRGDFFLTTGGSDLAQDGALWRVSPGSTRMVADLAAFERDNDPDAFEGPMWKDQRCEFIDGFSTGPQNNPFHVTTLSGSTALVADAAGNTLLSAKTNGIIDWVAVFTPPVDGNGEWLIRFHQDMVDEDTPIEGDPIPCYVQPVPTSVAIGPGGDYYVGELTGATEDGTLPIGLSRVWRIDSGAHNVVCSEADPQNGCEILIDGLTSVIDVAFGPDGDLYVVEYDETSWIATFAPAIASGGTISKYDPATGDLIEVVASGLEFPSAITFDKQGNLWVLENNDVPALAPPSDKVRPTVRQIEMP